MNKLWILLRVHIIGMLGINKMLHTKGKKEKRKFIRFAVLMVFVVLMLLFSSAFYDYIFIDIFLKAGVPQLMPALMMTLASLVTLITTIYKTNGLIFGFKDFDMTMAMPVKTSVVVASRLMVLYIINLGFCLLINVPAAVVYSVFVPVPATFFPSAIILSLFIPMIPMIIGTALGSIATAVSSKFRHASAINIVITFAMVIAAMAFPTKIQTMIFQHEQASFNLMNTVYGIYPLTRTYTQALCNGKVTSLLTFTAISVAFFAGVNLLISIFYKRINTALTTGRARADYRITSLKATSALSALYRREVRRYFAHPLYVMNSGIGMIIAALLGGSLLFFKTEQLEQMLEIPGFSVILGTLAPIILSMMACMSCTTSCSVSLEGSSLWIIKSLPVTPDMIFASKLLLNLTITIPPLLVSATFIAIALPIDAIRIVFLFITPAAFALLSAEFGLYLNLLYPNFTWTTDTTVIKQSMPVFISVIGGMGATMLLIFGLSQLPSSLQLVGLSAVTIVVILAAAALKRLLSIKGARLFNVL